ncbi:hypothetical protein F5Y15DRAFT_377810 [Xylariaceae sp. FL0016]|nr:hypothetical protein F5Y15DRAFT_377810 [Xylariaceae sp. FL0016]
MDHDEKTSHFVAATGVNTDEAFQYLTACNWDLDAAVQSYYAASDLDAPTSADAAAPAEYTGPRTLDGRPAPQAIPTTSSSYKKPAPKKKGLATLSSIGGGAHDHDDDDSDDDDDDRHRDTYAGGEKSGLALQDPNQRGHDPQRIINDIVAKAKSNSRRPESSSPSPGPSSSAAFRGSGQTLGGDDAPSRVIPDPRGPSSAGRPRQGDQPQVQERTLHLWSNGFSIDDGELRRFDDPANADALRMIREGRAPIQLMNVRYDEPLDVKLQQHDEEYRQLPKVYRPFGGEGRRLGSPVPGDTTTPMASSSSTTAASSSSTTSQPTTSVDSSQPTIMIRIQMLDGTRLPARFNTTQTVGDIYDFVTRASPGLGAGSWVVATTFPNKEHTDKSLVLGDMTEFKKGGTAVVKRST